MTSDQFRCDFCKETTTILRRIVIDKGYERLSGASQPKYACPSCSEAKDRKRLGLDALQDGERRRRKI